MIELLELNKNFDDIKAVNHVSLSIADGEVFGLVGTNGAGKSTLLRMISGVVKPDEGIVCIDHRPVYDNPEIKKDIFFGIIIMLSDKLNMLFCLCRSKLIIHDKMLKARDVIIYHESLALLLK